MVSRPPSAEKEFGKRARAVPGVTGRCATAVLACLALAGCNPADDRTLDLRPDIILISLDTTRADHLSAYGYDRRTTPGLERLAREGVRFERAYAPSATTGPSHASLFTGIYPIAHGVRKNGRVLRPEFETLAETLSAEGYVTGAVVSSHVLSEKFGYAQGFGSFDEDFSGASSPEASVIWEGELVSGRFFGTADDTTNRAIRWFDDRAGPDRPYFLFVHYFDPHDPYSPPPDFAAPFETGPGMALKLNRKIYLYDTLLSFVDREIERLFSHVRNEEPEGNLLVIVTGDHGEGLMDHGQLHHGVQVYEEAVRVPLIARWPGHLPAGLEVEHPVALLDLMPTMLELIGVLRPEAEFQGRSQADLFRGGPGSPQPIFLYRRHYEGGEEIDGLQPKGEQYAVRQGRFKLIQAEGGQGGELFDLEADPDERNDLSAAEPERLRELSRLIDEWHSAYARPDEVPESLSPEDRARLEALGYVQ